MRVTNVGSGEFTYVIGQSCYDSTYYVRVIDDANCWDYEYAHKPNKTEVMSDYADTLADETTAQGIEIHGFQYLVNSKSNFA